MPNGMSKKTSSLEVVQSETSEKSRWQRALAAVKAADGDGQAFQRAVSTKYMRGDSRFKWVRNQLRVQLESPRFESVTLGLVLLYGLLVLTDLGLDGLELTGWNAFFRVFDITFLGVVFLKLSFGFCLYLVLGCLFLGRLWSIIFD